MFPDVDDIEWHCLWASPTMVHLILMGCDKQRRNEEMCFEKQTWYTFLSQTEKFVYTLHAIYRIQMSKQKLIRLAHKQFG